MLTVVVVAAAVAASDCRPAEPARLRLEHVAMAIDRTGVHIAFEVVNDGGHDAFVFTTAHGTLYDESTHALKLFVRQHPFRPTGTTGDMTRGIVRLSSESGENHSPIWSCPK